MMRKIRVWDLPVRLFHWVLVLLIVVSVVTQNIGGNAMEWHFLSGYAVLALVAFRILWGLFGTRYARFSSMVHRPSAVLTYLRVGPGSKERKYLGHNPLGSLSVFAMLAVLLAQAGSGLFANDDIASEGPLVKFVSKELSDSITRFHTEVSANLLYFIIGLHLVAIGYYYLRRKENLVKPMITGDRELPFDAPHVDDSLAMRILAAAILAACGAGVYLLVSA